MNYVRLINTTFKYAFLLRTKVDMNRDVVEGAQGNPVAIAAYTCYHECIKRAKSSTNTGILFDLHGQVWLVSKIEIFIV